MRESIEDLKQKIYLTTTEASRVYGESAVKWAERMDAGEIQGRVRLRKDGMRRMRLLLQTSIAAWCERQHVNNAPETEEPAPSEEPGPNEEWNWRTKNREWLRKAHARIRSQEDQEGS